MKIEPLTFFAAQTAFSSYLTADEVFFLRIHQEGTHLLGAFHGETPLGIISWHQKADDGFQVDYVVVLEHARLQGVCFQLFKACFSFVRQAGGRLITCSLIQQTPFGTVMDEWLQKIGFHPAMSMRIIGCDMTDGNSAGWKEFMRTRGARYFLRGEKKGVSVVSYAEAKTSALRELEYEMGKSFPAYLSPFPYWEQTILDCSFLTLKDGSPIAYTSITENAGSGVLAPVMACAKNYVNSGAFFLALSKAIDSIFESENISRCSFTVYENNSPMLRLTESFLSCVITDNRRQIVYHGGADIFEKSEG